MEFSAASGSTRQSGAPGRPAVAEPGEAPPTNPRGLRLDRVPAPPPPPTIEQSPLEDAIGELDLEIRHARTGTAHHAPADAAARAGSRMITAGDAPDGQQNGQQNGQQGDDPDERPARSLRLVAVAVVCCLLGTALGAGLALVDRTSMQRQRQAAPILARAAGAVQQVQDSGNPLQVARTVVLLQQIQGLNTRVQATTGGAAWQLARRTVRREPLTSTGDRAAGLALVADAAGPLLASLHALHGRNAGTPDSLDELARDLNRFASVSIRAEELGTWTTPSRQLLNPTVGTPFERLATAAAILPTMAGSEAPRAWVICRSPTTGCTRAVLDAGRVRSVRRVTPAARTARGADITLTGAAAGDLLAGGAWSVPAVLNLLVATGDGEDDATPVLSSTVPVEQHALDVLAGRRVTGTRAATAGRARHGLKTIN